MQPRLTITATLDLLVERRLGDPEQLGLAIGQLLDSIKPLVDSHLRHAADCRFPDLDRFNIDITDFLASVEDYLCKMRSIDGIEEAFSKAIDRERAKMRNMFRMKYVALLELQLKKLVVDKFGVLFTERYKEQETRLFNKGVARALNNKGPYRHYQQWKIFPTENVCIATCSRLNEDWAMWFNQDVARALNNHGPYWYAGWKGFPVEELCISELSRLNEDWALWMQNQCIQLNINVQVCECCRGVGYVADPPMLSAPKKYSQHRRLTLSLG